MRELVFEIEYEPGANTVADTLAAYPGATIRSLSLHVTPESLWRVDHASGPHEALAAIEETFLTADYYADCLSTADCGATQRTTVLERDEVLVLYSYWERTASCASVPHLALSHLGDGALFETRHQERTYRWRIIHPGGAVGKFFEALEAAVGDAGTVSFERVSEASAGETQSSAQTDATLPPEQEAALRAAVEYGYYETPREVGLKELSDRLDVPRSTLAYRLRRAEAALAESFIARARTATGATPL